LEQKDNSISNSLLFKDQQSFERIYSLYWKKVYAVCYNNVKIVEVAQGMVQDIFLSLWERRDNLSINSSIEHYLVRAAKMKVFEYYRNKTIHQTHLAKIQGNSACSTCSTEHEVFYNDLNVHLQTWVGDLPAQSQRVHSLRMEGMSNKEIGFLIGISEKAVEYHITKVLRFLQQKIRFAFDS